MLSRIEHNLNQYLKVRNNIVLILSDAGSVERFLKAPGNKNVPSMYQLIETSYLKSEHGYWDKIKLKLRATPKQMSNYETAIDLLLMIDESISEDPLLMRKIVWLKSTRNSYSSIGRYLFYHRTTIKRMYDNILDKLSEIILLDNLSRTLSYIRLMVVR